MIKELHDEGIPWWGNYMVSKVQDENYIMRELHIKRLHDEETKWWGNYMMSELHDEGTEW